jgi:hypothetical protein
MLIVCSSCRKHIGCVIEHDVVYCGDNFFCAKACAKGKCPLRDGSRTKEESRVDRTICLECAKRRKPRKTRGW